MFLGNYSYHPQDQFSANAPSNFCDAFAFRRRVCALSTLLYEWSQQSNKRAKKVSRFILGMCPVLGIALRWVVCLDVILGYYSVRSCYRILLGWKRNAVHWGSAHSYVSLLLGTSHLYLNNNSPQNL